MIMTTIISQLLLIIVQFLALNPSLWKEQNNSKYSFVWGLIHETDLRGKLRPKHEVRNYRRKVAIHESGQREVAT